MSKTPTPHIGAAKEQIAKTVLMPGDPLRAKFIAENFLTDFECVNTVRNMLAFTGNYQGKRVTVAGGLGAIFAAKKSPAETLKDKLCAQGFDAFIYESPLEQIQKNIQAGEKPDLNMYFAGKTPIKEFRENQDLILTLVDIPGGFQPVARPAFGMTKGGGEIPWYVFELPVVVIGVQHPFVLADIPQARTYINAYDSKDVTMDALIAKLMAGEEAFTGKDPVDSFCGLFDTRI